jgi:hypothetical protein
LRKKKGSRENGIWERSYPPKFPEIGVDGVSVSSAPMLSLLSIRTGNFYMRLLVETLSPSSASSASNPCSFGYIQNAICACDFESKLCCFYFVCCPKSALSHRPRDSTLVTGEVKFKRGFFRCTCRSQSCCEQEKGARLSPQLQNPLAYRATRSWTELWSSQLEFPRHLVCFE